MRPQSPSTILTAAECKAFLVSNLFNIQYLSGLQVSAGLLLVRPRAMEVFVDARYAEAVQTDAWKGIRVRAINEAKKSMENLEQCGIEAEDVTLARLRFWKRNFKNTKFVQKEGIITEFRRAKEQDELKNFTKAQRITQKMLKRIPSVLTPGITERELAWKLECWSRELGAEGLAFDPIVAFGTNTSRPHHHPTNRKLKQGHLVQIDVGAKVSGYCADQSRVFSVGAMTTRQQEVLAAVKKAKELAEKACRVGITNHALDIIARDSLKESNLEQYFVHSLGHGVGLEIHEGITLSTKAPKKKLLKNEIITIEPGVYIPGQFGIRLEDEIIIQ